MPLATLATTTVRNFRKPFERKLAKIFEHIAAGST